MTRKSEGSIRVYGGKTYTEESFKKYKDYQAKFEDEKYYQCKFRVRVDRDPELVAFLKKITEEKRLGPYLRNLTFEDMERSEGKEGRAISILLDPEKDRELIDQIAKLSEEKGESGMREALKDYLKKSIIQ